MKPRLSLCHLVLHALICAVALLSACAHNRSHPQRTFTLGAESLSLTDPSQANLCTLSEAKIQSEWAAASETLGRYVEAAAPSSDGTWTSNAALLHADMQRVWPVLSPLLDRAVRDTQQCDGPLSPALVRLRDDLALHHRTVEDRLRSTHLTSADIMHLAAIEGWKRRQSTAMNTARQRVCRSRSDGQRVFYAAQDANGSREWVFCDSSRLVHPVGGESEFIPPAETSARIAKKMNIARYRSNAKSFPADRIDFAPESPNR